MKKAILLLAIICATFASQAQEDEEHDFFNQPPSVTQTEPKAPLSVGDHLTKAGHSYTISLTAFIIGSGTAIIIEDPDTKIIVLAGTFVVSLVSAYAGHMHLVLAGKKANNLSVGIGGQGLSMTYNF